MNQTEQVGWVGMGIGLLITSLPFITSIYGMSFDSRMLVISFLGLVAFFLGASKALPEILYNTFSNVKQNKTIDKTSRQPVNEQPKIEVEV